MNGVNSFDKTDREYSIAHSDDLILFWRSKVKVTASLILCWREHPRRRWGVEVRFSVVHFCAWNSSRLLLRRWIHTHWCWWTLLSDLMWVPCTRARSRPSWSLLRSTSYSVCIWCTVIVSGCNHAVSWAGCRQLSDPATSGIVFGCGAPVQESDRGPRLNVLLPSEAFMSVLTLASSQTPLGSLQLVFKGVAAQGKLGREQGEGKTSV